MRNREKKSDFEKDIEDTVIEMVGRERERERERERDRDETGGVS